MMANISKRSLSGISFGSGSSALGLGLLATTYTGSGSIVNTFDSKKGTAAAFQPILKSDICDEL